ncbi:MAG: hypothetical protein UY87_C0066G0012 [Candidatus Peribacteria bacterium GW2011_GWC2_54_8]|nr:MAG: hypothetical protein UY87_C0066G0012 [Candidatus Peribacteria bacterium GW2011_GWC2_54_8]KKW41494.1 MAG: hypothetical protein UY90_C0051G0005 [Candidatus Peregrinibacteria bacterium GW2011_GWA2_54_9]
MAEQPSASNWATLEPEREVRPDTALFPIKLSPDSAGGHGRKAVELHWLCAAVIAAMMLTDKRRRV